jgi:hypothetical protein
MEVKWGDARKTARDEIEGLVSVKKGWSPARVTVVSPAEVTVDDRGRYSGKLVGTIGFSDFTKAQEMKIREAIGRITKKDKGKQVWEYQGNFNVENDEQREERCRVHQFGDWKAVVEVGSRFRLEISGIRSKSAAMNKAELAAQYLCELDAEED